jgi:hypothetical protein
MPTKKGRSPEEQAMTRLEPLSPERACQLYALLRRAAQESGSTLSLDQHGRVQKIAPAEQTETAEHVLGDLDVHA